MGNLFSPNGDNEEGKEEKLIAICSQLHLTKEQLNRLQKPNDAKTARAIVRTCYSTSVRASVKPEEIDDQFRTAVHGKYLPIFVYSKSEYTLESVSMSVRPFTR
jgi:L-rhamnose isomerase